jgi:hypothetical protein
VRLEHDSSDVLLFKITGLMALREGHVADTAESRGDKFRNETIRD